MSAWWYLALLVPLIAGIVRWFRGWFALNALLTGSCAAIVIFARGGFSLLAAGLIVSIAADWCMAHKRGRTVLYLCGIGGFFVAHTLFLWDVIARFTFAPLPFVVFGALVVIYSVFLCKRILPRVSDVRMRVAVVLYMLISAASFGLSFGAGSVIYTLGIAMIVFSDTLIAENDFAGNHAVGRYILPTYFACHILLAISALVSGGM